MSLASNNSSELLVAVLAEAVFVPPPPPPLALGMFIPSAFNVAFPTTPSTVRPFFLWKAFTPR